MGTIMVPIFIIGVDRDMGLLMEAAKAWHSLQSTRYYLMLGWRGKWSSDFVLDFQPEQFPHLAGIHYADDVDFGVNRAELRGERFLSKLLEENSKIDDSLIEKAAKWDTWIKGRLQGIIALEATLDSDFIICQYDPAKVPYGTQIQAKYVIKNVDTGMNFFVFLNEDEGQWFCCSVFQLRQVDFTINQRRVKVLKKRKWIGANLVIDYTNPNYIPNDK